jgi:hypothetical protein
MDTRIVETMALAASQQAQDAGLPKDFRHGLDVHKATAAEVFGVALDEVSGDQRRSAKALNFGLIYGMSAFDLAKQIGCERKQVQDYIDRYFARYSGVLAYMERTREQAAQQEPVGYRAWFLKEPDNIMVEWGKPIPKEPNPSSHQELLYVHPAPQQLTLPKRKQPPELMLAMYHEALGHNRCLDEIERLNKGEKP